ncbi:insecticyanin-A-like [Plodia interpunctella]|uniref:insecticyanin-A-like n=1 Tax=Plodia interpunctella TaxID=58824 RepID=UPI0023677E59|nr:insecticyanin-A-like [Plodia interpunctella]
MLNVVFFVLICVVLNNGISNSQVLQFGRCTDVKTMEYFQLEKFLGLWYEIERFPIWYEDYGSCAYKRIQACGRHIEIDHSFIRDGVQYILHVNSSYVPGDDAVFVIEHNNIDPMGVPLTIITTDYTNYAVVYGCNFNEHIGIKYISAWILSRNSTLDTETRDKARLELNAIPYASVAYLEPVPQSEADCDFHWTAHVQSVNMENYINND